MKGIKHHQSTLRRFGESFFLKMATKLLLSVSIYSLILSYFNFSFSAYPKQFLGYSIDKNYMFLLCNGILVFIVKNSGAIDKSLEESENDVHRKNAIENTDRQQQIFKFSEMKESIVEKKVDMEVEDQAQETEKCSSLVVVGAETFISVAQDDGDGDGDGDDGEEDEEQEQGQENGYLIINKDEDEDEGIWLLSTEELNKKCDDFIRKMKEEIKFEAQQWIMV